MKDPQTSDPPTAPAVRATVPLEVRETDTSVLVSATLPDVRPYDVRVQIQGDALTITAARRPARGQPPAVRTSQPAAHPRAASFEGMATLPAAVNALAARASMDGDVVTVTLPKAGEPADAPPAVSSANPEVARHDVVRGEAIGAAQRKRERDPVTRESHDSFPSSDPPSWTGGRT